VTAPAEPVTAAFGRRARELRQERGWSLERMAARPGLNISAVRRAERGGNIRLATAERIAGALGVPLADMLGAGSCGHCRECGAKVPEVSR
jgi:transcriptional regulator with XRE-family HTH domain